MHPQGYEGLLHIIGSASFSTDHLRSLSLEISGPSYCTQAVQELLSHPAMEFPLLALIEAHTLVRDYTQIHELAGKEPESTTKVNLANYHRMEELIGQLRDPSERAALCANYQKFEEPDVKTSFFKYSGMVDDLGRRLGKKIQYVVEGASVSLPSDRLSLLNDAMVHMIRNSIDHAIETIEERAALGKSPEGVVRVTLRENAQGFDLLLSDDGCGIDGECLFQKAIKTGAVPSGAILSIQEKQKLIFLPNLSTKEQVSELSGRGVGMDVVQANIAKLGGSLELKSELGRGTEFHIQLPA
jgi:sensor histidine kinase regulating citrate/malate metabolism